MWELAPTTCILTSEEELPPRRERSWTRTTLAPWRAAEMAAQTPARLSSAELPFGGVKQSGFGREGGHHGLEEYLDTKLVCVGDVNA